MTTAVTSEFSGYSENRAHSVATGTLTGTSPGRWSE
jgi:hypothetical protein